MAAQKMVATTMMVGFSHMTVNLPERRREPILMIRREQRSGGGRAETAGARAVCVWIPECGACCVEPRPKLLYQADRNCGAGDSRLSSGPCTRAGKRGIGGVRSLKFPPMQKIKISCRAGKLRRPPRRAQSYQGGGRGGERPPRLEGRGWRVVNIWHSPTYLKGF